MSDDGMEMLAGIVIQALDSNGLTDTWLRKLVDLIANHGYDDLERAKARATELQEWEDRIRTRRDFEGTTYN